MDKRFNLVQGKPGKEGKVYWHRIGTMYQKDDGSCDILLDSLPVPQYDPQYGNQLRVKAFPGDDSSKGNKPQQPKAGDSFGDDIPW